MATERTIQLAAALQRPRDDPLVARIAALILDLEAGRLTVADAEERLATDASLQPIRSLLSFQDAEVRGSITIGDVAGGHIVHLNLIFSASSTYLAPSKYWLLGLCATAHAPLTINDLQQLAPHIFRRRVDLREAAGEASTDIVGDGSDGNGYTFKNIQRSRHYLSNGLSEREQKNFQRMFVSWGQTWYTKRNTSLRNYLRQFWIAHIAEVGQWDAAIWEIASSALTELVLVDQELQQPWAAARYAVEGNYVGYLGDLDLLWHWAELHYKLPLGLYCALLKSTLSTKHGHNRIFADTWAKAEILSLAALLPHLHISQWTDVCARALDATDVIADTTVLAEVWAALVPYLDADQRISVWKDMVPLARRIEDDNTLANLLGQLTPYLNIYRRLIALEFIIWRLHNKQCRQVLARLMCAPAMTNIIIFGLKLIPGIPAILLWYGRFLSWCLPRMIRWAAWVYVEVRVLAQVVWWRFQARISSGWDNFLRRIRLRDSTEDRFWEDTSWSEDFDTARDNMRGRQIDDWEEQGSDYDFPYLWHAYQDVVKSTTFIVLIKKIVGAFGGAITYVVSSVRALVRYCRYRWRLHQIKYLPHTQQRIVELAKMLRDSPVSRRFPITQKMFIDANSIIDEQVRAFCLIGLATHFSDEQLHQAVNALCVITDEKGRARSLIAIAPHVPYKLIPEMLTTLCQITNQFWRDQALRAFAQRLQSWTESESSPHHFDVVCGYWQKTVRMLSDYSRPDLLTSVAALIPWLAVLATPDELEEIAETICAIMDYHPSVYEAGVEVDSTTHPSTPQILPHPA
jgi:hypothetical protein